MLYTLSQAREKVKAHVDGGSCNTVKIDEYINDALERLMESERWDSLQVMTRITTCNACFPLPYNVSGIIGASIDGTPANIFNRAYQFMHAGPGDLDLRTRSSSFRDLADMGDQWATMFDIPHAYENTVSGTTSTVELPDGLRLCAFCTDSEDDGTSLKVMGYKVNGEIVRSGAAEGEELRITRWSGGVDGVLPMVISDSVWDGIRLSTNLFGNVTRIVKPETQGYISLYAVDPDTDRMFFLGKYHPRQTIPQFRRYRITNKEAGVSATTVLALLKLRYVPLVEATDVLPIESMQAVKLMVMSISEENKQNLQGSVALAQLAVSLLSKKEESKHMNMGYPAIVDSDYRTSLGRHLNRNMIL